MYAKASEPQTDKKYYTPHTRNWKWKDVSIEHDMVQDLFTLRYTWIRKPVYKPGYGYDTQYVREKDQDKITLKDGEGVDYKTIVTIWRTWDQKSIRVADQKKRGRGIEIKMKKGYTEDWEGCRQQMSYECVTMDREILWVVRDEVIEHWDLEEIN